MAHGAKYERVVLTGFMGAGKTTVGRLLAGRLDWNFIDTDDVVTAGAGVTVAALFALHGEDYFRSLEAEAVAESLRRARAVVALGGGALEHAGTRALIADDRNTLPVHLETPLAVALQRCAAHRGGADRPLLGETADIERRFVARLPFYQTARLSIATEGRLPEAIAEAIAAEVLA